MKSKNNNDSLTPIIHAGNFIGEPLSIANVFNGFFSTVAQKMQSKIKLSEKSFSDFLPHNIHESIILSQITEDEISKIISSLNSSKSTGPNSIPTKISKLLQVQTSNFMLLIFLTYHLLLVFFLILENLPKLYEFIKKILETGCV